MTAIDWEHVARARLHPVQVRILDELATRETFDSVIAMTPKQLAPAVGASLELTAYHCRALRKQGLLELVAEGIGQGTRGAVQHHYALADGVSA